MRSSGVSREGWSDSVSHLSPAERAMPGTPERAVACDTCCRTSTARILRALASSSKPAGAVTAPHSGHSATAKAMMRKEAWLAASVIFTAARRRDVRLTLGVAEVSARATSSSCDYRRGGSGDV